MFYTDTALLFLYNTVILQSFAWRSLFCVFVFSTPNFKRSRQIIKDECCENSWDQNGKQFVLTKIEIKKVLFEKKDEHR